MMNMIEQGMNWLASVQRDHMSTEVVYHHGPDTYPCPAVVGTVQPEESDLFDDVVLSRVFDFIIPVEDLPIIPEEGDIIVYQGQQHEVIPSTFEGPWRWSDSHRVRRRIHTQHLGDA